MNPYILLQKYLGAETDLYRLVEKHSLQVSIKALGMASNHPELPIDVDFVAEAALLHDIGVFLTWAPELGCTGSSPYICHGFLGRRILDDEGLPRHALVCERHTGTGLYLPEIKERKLPLPHRDLAPVTLEEQLICFADKFYSKSVPDRELAVEEVRNNLHKYGEAGVERFDRWCALFL